ncbi:MAG: carbohydrate-binding protein [Flavisolibacter sp.]
MKHLRPFSLFAAVTLILTLSFSQAQAQVQTARYISMGSNTNAFYEYLPQGYASNTSQTYPLLIFIHGTGELGDGSPGQLTRLLNTGVAASINVGEMPVSFNVNGQSMSFIVISPQFVNWPSAADVDNVINYAVSHYRVNLNRVYLTGLSMGGGAVWDYVGNNSTYANRIAAIAPFAGASWPDHTRARTIAGANIAVWAFHNDNDPTVPSSYTNDYVAQINEAPAPNPQARKTIFSASQHDCWTYVYNSSYKENNMSVYQWLLQYQRGSTPPPSNNQLPTANAGPDQNINGNSVQINGSGSDPDGTVTNYSWTKISGPSQYNISSASVPNPTLSNLVGGSYTFRLSVSDNTGGSAYDDVVINVFNTIPGRIEAENFATMSGINTENTTDAGGGQDVGWQDNNDWMDYNVNVPSAGNYAINFRVATINVGTQFQVKKSDGTVLATVNVPSTGGWQTWQNVSANVSLPAGQQTLRIFTNNAAGGWNINWMDFSLGSGGSNQAPTANAGADQTITLPSSSANLSGSGTDADGSIASYQWSELTGPSNANFSAATSAATGVSGLVQGAYTFRLKVTDNGGATATDDIVVTVNGSTPSTGSTLHIEAENWSAMSGVNKETTSDAGGGYNVGSQDLNDWVDYSVNIPSAGTYTANFRIATMVAGAQFQVKKSDGTVLATVNVPSTGAYQNWQTISTQLNLSAGQQTIRIATVASPGGWNLNWLDLIGGGSSSNQSPVANAGADQTITLPSSSATLSGSGTDADGSIASYQWSELSGPSNANFSAATSAQTSVSALLAGSYNFRLTVKDNTGATATDDVIVTVNASAGGTATTIHIEAENWSTMSGVSKEATSDAGGGYNVGSQDLNDWSEYSVNIPSAGTYTANFRIATMVAGAQFQIRKSDGTVLATVNVPSTGAYQSWQTISAQITLGAGQQTLRIATIASPGGWNLNWFDLVGGGSITPPPVTATTLHIEAENWSAMGGVNKETTSDIGGGYNVGSQDLNDWADYSVNIASAGNYTMNFRIATMVAGAQFQIRKSDGTVLATVNVPSTGAYQSWQTISAQVTLDAGQQTLRIATVASPGGWNLNWFEIAGPNTTVTAAATKTVVETTASTSSSIEVFPNPVTDRFLLQVNSELTGTMTVQIFDMNGSLQKQFTVAKPDAGASQTYLSIGELPVGQYLLKLTLGQWTQTTKLIKQ